MALRGRVLLVDDDLHVAQAIRRVLEREHDVVVVHSGMEAIATLESEQAPDFDVILCDMHMPGLSGPDVFRHLSQHHPGLVPSLVFLSGSTLSPEEQDFFRSSGRPAVAKPFDVGDFRHFVREFVTARRV